VIKNKALNSFYNKRLLVTSTTQVSFDSPSRGRSR
jgi:hypothetical protein